MACRSRSYCQGGNNEKILVGPSFSNDDVIRAMRSLLLPSIPNIGGAAAPVAPPVATPPCTECMNSMEKACIYWHIKQGLWKPTSPGSSSSNDQLCLMGPPDSSSKSTSVLVGLCLPKTHELKLSELAMTRLWFHEAWSSSRSPTTDGISAVLTCHHGPLQDTILKVEGPQSWARIHNPKS